MRRKETILVVEDDAALRQLYWQALTYEGFEVLTAEDGLTALECLRHARPSLVVLDLNVPRVSGREIHRAMMADPQLQQVPVIVVTGVDPAGVAAQAAALLRKPIAVSQLVEEIYRRVSVA